MLAVEVIFKTFESNHHDCYVIQSLLIKGQFHYILHSPPAELVNILKTALVSLEGVPHNFDDLSIG